MRTIRHFVFDDHEVIAGDIEIDAVEPDIIYTIGEHEYVVDEVTNVCLDTLGNDSLDWPGVEIDPFVFVQFVHLSRIVTDPVDASDVRPAL